MNSSAMFTQDAGIKQKKGNGRIPPDELLELAAHDLQSPLRKLSILSERLVSKFLPSDNNEAKEYLQRINACVKDMQEMIGGLTLLGNLDETNLRPEICEVEKIINEQLEQQFAERHPDDKVSIRDGGSVLADPKQLAIAFNKLIENAFIFKTEGKPAQINIYGRPVTDAEKDQFGISQPSGYRAIVFADEGVGFSKEDAEKIFQPFVRLHGKSSYPGKGLGLAWVEKIVQLNKGFVYATLQENGSANFVILLPQKTN